MPESGENAILGNTSFKGINGKGGAAQRKHWEDAHLGEGASRELSGVCLERGPADIGPQPRTQWSVSGEGSSRYRALAENSVGCVWGGSSAVVSSAEGTSTTATAERAKVRKRVEAAGVDSVRLMPSLTGQELSSLVCC